MKLAIMVPLVIVGLVLLATPLLPVGLLLLLLGWWVFERSRLSNSDALITFLMVVGGCGAVATIGKFIAERMGF